ncbi:FadR/GntR family transcriptional regulator [Zhongshania aquimaris]|uniref:FadR family transcriptional regulator n=1 Tax=Zhongshania aquimaris TaxID=2857107 RepID=A0ABS6VX64_9GAMM|nr:FadR/GntR family transcriptional regulator [Zhongshania aquimaris]MBW2942221.1 FadR family transcriptional regulator [Zhongshania aquimaris]
MPDSDLNQATSLSSQVSQYLWEYISREKLRPGDDVLSEMQIGRDLGISRTTVREAYRSLAAVGILEIGNGRRPRLMSMNSSVLAQVFGYALQTTQISYRQVMETRRSIEVQTAQLAAIRATDEQKLSLKSHIAAMRDAMDDHQRRVSADLALHQELAEASHNPVNRLLLDALQNPLMESLLVDLGSQRTLSDISRIIDAHENIVNHICDGDAVAAGNAMYSHFELSASIGSPT